MEPNDVIEAAGEHSDKLDRFTSLIAITVALLAVFMGVFKIKDDNICQAMQQAQADRIDNWGWYQAHKTRVEIGESTLAQLSAMPATPATTKAIATWTTSLSKQQSEAKDVKSKAEAAQKAYDDYNYRDDQFDMSDASLALAIALLAVTALTRKRALYYFALAPSVFGLVMGISGLFGFLIHPDFLAKFLGT